MTMKTTEIYKQLLFLVMLALFSSASAEKELKLIGYDQMISEINAVKVTDKTHFKERRKNGAPKYLHQLKDEFYYMQVKPPGHYTLALTPTEWFDIQRIEADKFKVRIIKPLEMWSKFKSAEFDIRWQVDENVYCDECDNIFSKSKFKSEPGLPKLSPPFKLLGFDEMMKEFYSVKDTDDIQLKTRNEKGRPKFLHQIKDEVYTLVVSEPGDYSLKLKPASWFEIKQTKGHVFRVQFIDPLKIRREEYAEGFSVDWQLDEVAY